MSLDVDNPRVDIYMDISAELYSKIKTSRYEEKQITLRVSIFCIS